LLAGAKQLAKDYRRLTGKPLGVTGEVAEYEAASLLGLDLAVARQAGYDAVERVDDHEVRVQIKGRCVTGSTKSRRVPSINRAHDWDVVMLVLLDEGLNAITIYEAERSAVEKALDVPGSKARNKRGALSISKFRSIARQRWPQVPDG